jgi:HK97 family phage prohead protease
MQITRKDAAITKAPDSTEGPGTFEAILSAPTKDRDGDTLLSSEWKTPLPARITVDIDHDMSVRGTIGSAVPWIDDDGNLRISGTFASTPLAQEVRTLMAEGHIDKTSVAFMSDPATQKDGKTVRMRELLNAAVVAIPSNREAAVLGVRAFKSGARNSKTDAAAIQGIHDHAAGLGADCSATAKSFSRVEVKSVEGSLEATQDRARDALNDAYGTDAWVWLRATLPAALVFDISTSDSSETETYQQDYTDDGSVVTLTGERRAVDLAEIVKPDPDENAEPAAEVDAAAAAEKSAAAVAETKAADDAASEAVRALSVDLLAASFIV